MKYGWKCRREQRSSGYDTSRRGNGRPSQLCNIHMLMPLAAAAAHHQRKWWWARSSVRGIHTYMHTYILLSVVASHCVGLIRLEIDRRCFRDDGDNRNDTQRQQQRPNRQSRC